MTYTLGHLSNSTATTAVFNKTTWVPTILTQTLSADADESSITGQVKIQSLHNTDPSRNDEGSLFRIDGLALQEGDYDASFIGPDDIRKSGQVSWQIGD